MTEETRSGNSLARNRGHLKQRNRAVVDAESECVNGKAWRRGCKKKAAGIRRKSIWPPGRDPLQEASFISEWQSANSPTLTPRFFPSFLRNARYRMSWKARARTTERRFPRSANASRVLQIPRSSPALSPLVCRRRVVSQLHQRSRHGSYAVNS